MTREDKVNKFFELWWPAGTSVDPRAKEMLSLMLSTEEHLGAARGARECREVLTGGRR